MQLYVLVYIFVAIATTGVSTEKTDSSLAQADDVIQKIDNDLVLQVNTWYTIYVCTFVIVLNARIKIIIC